MNGMRPTSLVVVLALLALAFTSAVQRSKLAEIHVKGTITDPNGHPIAGATIRLAPPLLTMWTSTRSTLVRFDEFTTRSRRDGTFAFARPLPARDVHLSVSGHVLLRPGACVALDAATREHTLAIVARPDSFLRGVVVDERGEPVADAEVEVVEPDRRISAERATDARGRFELQSSEVDDRDAPFAIRVFGATFETLQTDAVHRLDAEPVRLVVRDGVPFEVRVVRDADDTPVDEFDVRLLPVPRPDFALQMIHQIGLASRASGRHTNGIARIRHVRPDDYLLCIEPSAASSLCAAWFVPITIGKGRPDVATVRLAAPVSRRVIVERADGAPVAGASVVLALRYGHGNGRGNANGDGPPTEIDEELGDLPSNGRLAITRATTAADGGCELRGSPHESFVAFVSGDGFRPLAVDGLRLDESAPFRIVLPNLARLTGRLRPIEVLDQLTPRVGGMPMFPANIAVQRSRIDAAGTHRRSDAPEFVAIGADGAFAIDGIPPGAWDVVLLHQFVAGWALDTCEVPLRIGETFGAGETVELDLDIGALRTADVRGTVHRDGVAFEGHVRLTRLHPPAAIETISNVHGKFHAWLPPGDWHVAIRDANAPRRTPWLGADASVALPSGQRTEATWQVRTARLRLRVSTPNGSPAARVAIGVQRADRSTASVDATTDDAGAVELALSGGEHVVVARRGAVTFTVGTCVLPVKDDVVDLRLPQEWDR